MNRKQHANALSAGLFLMTGLFANSVLAQDPIINGSFETGDYTGWTLVEFPAGSPTYGTWGIATNGQTINPGELVFDYFDGIFVTQNSPGLPRTYTATDGDHLAFQLQNGSQLHTMSQDITLCTRATELTWDMEYRNHTSFLATQYSAVELRNPLAPSTVLATLFRTLPGDPQSSAMSPRSADISAYAGQTVRLQVTHQVQNFFFDAAWDNFRIESCEKIIVGIDIKPGSFPNSINLGSGGATPVAILGSATLDVNDIDRTTLTLGTSGIKTVGKKDKQLCSVADVSGDFTTAEGAPDGFDDLVCHFETMTIVPEAGNTEALVSGALIDGTRIEGTDSVNLVP